jgi:hypothetical protein
MSNMSSCIGNANVTFYYLEIVVAIKIVAQQRGARRLNIWSHISN